MRSGGVGGMRSGGVSGMRGGSRGGRGGRERFETIHDEDFVIPSDRPAVPLIDAIYKPSKQYVDDAYIQSSRDNLPFCKSAVSLGRDKYIDQEIARPPKTVETFCPIFTHDMDSRLGRVQPYDASENKLGMHEPYCSDYVTANM